MKLALYDIRRKVLNQCKNVTLVAVKYLGDEGRGEDREGKKRNGRINRMERLKGRRGESGGEMKEKVGREKEKKRKRKRGQDGRRKKNEIKVIFQYSIKKSPYFLLKLVSVLNLNQNKNKL